MRKTVHNENYNNSLQPMVTEEFEKLDTSIFVSMRSRPPERAIFDKYNYAIVSSKRDTQLVITPGSENLSIFRNHELYKTYLKYNNGITTYEEFITPYLLIEKTFYANGNIQSKGIGSWLGFSVGKGFRFNEQGKLIKIQDAEQGYNFSFDDVLRFCEQNKISLRMNAYEYPQSVLKLKEGNRHIWFIRVFYAKYGRWMNIILDGNTGALKRTFPIPEIAQ